MRQYEPFFSPTHEFEFNAIHGVSSVLFYDPVGRAVATLNPDHTYTKVVFDPWQQTTHDANDTRCPPCASRRTTASTDRRSSNRPGHRQLRRRVLRGPA